MSERIRSTVWRRLPRALLRRLTNAERASPSSGYRSITVSAEEAASGAYKRYLAGGVDEWDRRGEFQLHLLRRLGLAPHHSLLDAGCGPARAARFFIRYLEEAKYTGVDYNPDFISIARATMANDRLQSKRPRFAVVDDFRVGELEQQFDFVLAFSVLNHCDETQRRAFFTRVNDVLAPGGRVIITHAVWFRAEVLKGIPLEVRRHELDGPLFTDLSPTAWGWHERDSILPILELRTSELEARPTAPQGRAASVPARILTRWLPTRAAALFRTKAIRILRVSRSARTEIAYRCRRWAGGPISLGAPVFVVGCGHSGTSLMLALLGAHSRLCAIPFESDFAFQSEHVRTERMEEFGKLAIASGKARWVEKTPRHILRMDVLLAVHPDARIVVMLRDGRDVACSLKARVGEFEEGVRRWVADNLAAEHFWEHERVRVIRYEDVVSDFAGTLERLMGFLGETYEPSMKDFYREKKRFYDWRVAKPLSPTAHDQYRNWQINQPLFDGRNRWTAELAPEEKATFRRLAGEMLIKYGYARDDEW